ncbi:MAG TPA: tetratricopeptide repeat protein [Candidatus Krumholzibacteria bacterium]|nr:tetratricopeptide repeat protein [Candidatus Krumholzibacteria bacterium]HPD72788.1 tetratricopeptide repeat protein [Candidatus Krumholzibacteria bacterium]HRY40280.1 tetratricopeptide repeat protein [Candidatus Krumholzibacteria bacterium]
MAFFRKLFGGRGSDAYTEGIALYEQGRAAEAISFLRPVFEQDPGSPRGSLAGFYLRQALVDEGRRLLQAGDPQPASRALAEAAAHWPEFPDLQFLAGAALGLAARWNEALDSARQALRRNPDYCEARLLEACALQALGRPRETAASLERLIESGRRVDHPLVHELAREDGYRADTIPGDLDVRLRRTVLGDDTKRQLAEAVALCRAGRWDEGLASFRQLEVRHPRFPDIRAKHAASLYQAGQNAAALALADAALALNPRYRTAVCLKGLILAEEGRVLEARSFLSESVPRLDSAAGRHEELFLAYLRATLALLVGELEECRGFLSGWHELPRQFARAALLLAACDDLAGRPEVALRRLDDLCNVWTGDVDLLFLRVALQLRLQRWSVAESTLNQWPGGRRGLEDSRPLLLRARLDLQQGREPILPSDRSSPERPDDGGPDDPVAIHRAAWRQLAIRACLGRGEGDGAMALARRQLDEGLADEETGCLVLRAAAVTGQTPPADLAGRIGAADSWGLDLCRQLRLQGLGSEAEIVARRHWQVRPDVLQWSWLSAGFWLGPVRRWLA